MVWICEMVKSEIQWELVNKVEHLNSNRPHFAVNNFLQPTTILFPSSHIQMSDFGGDDEPYIFFNKATNKLDLTTAMKGTHSPTRMKN